MPEEGKCVIAIEEAIKRALSVAVEEVKNTVCTEEDFDKALKKVLGSLLGVEANPTECSIVLSQPMTERVCRDFYEQRRWVMCRAHQKLKEMYKTGQIADLGEAIEEAWDELKEKCLAAGHPV